MQRAAPSKGLFEFYVYIWRVVQERVDRLLFLPTAQPAVELAAQRDGEGSCICGSAEEQVAQSRSVSHQNPIATDRFRNRMCTVIESLAGDESLGQVSYPPCGLLWV